MTPALGTDATHWPGSRAQGPGSAARAASRAAPPSRQAQPLPSQPRPCPHTGPALPPGRRASGVLAHPAPKAARSHHQALLVLEEPPATSFRRVLPPESPRVQLNQFSDTNRLGRRRAHLGS
uniref:synapsin-2-like n=1 Tax=Macaca mulatta TaxID=9544 RepID=UPI0010A208EC|nr:synapsin-2-like [Macaca mulatta]